MSESDELSEMNLFPELIDEEDVEEKGDTVEDIKRRFEMTREDWYKLLEVRSDEGEVKKARVDMLIGSYPCPDESAFIRYYAPREPLILLPNHFKTRSESVDVISEQVDGYLKSKTNIVYSSSGSTWSGTIGNGCRFRICIYRSLKEAGQYIVEAQRLEGDGFLFGSFYQGLRRLGS
jgi:hypothetical protein